MAKCILHLQEVFVVADRSGTRNLLGTGVGTQQIESIANRFGSDQVRAPAPLQLAVLVHGIIEILVRLEPLQSSTHLAGQLLRIDLLAFHGGQPFELGLRFGQSGLPP